MSALLPDQARAMREMSSRQADAAASLESKWQNLHNQASRLAALANLSPEPFDGPLAAFPESIGMAADWRRELAWQGLDDIDAMMGSGLVALSTLKERGAAASAPALALWREFYEARSAIMALADSGEIRPE